MFRSVSTEGVKYWAFTFLISCGVLALLIPLKQRFGLGMI
ncbi:hypothetical protein EJK51_1929 [Moraxella catarrhalis]|nr:hypothetical protein EJK52_1927 [Moraxella catarrhalis]AZQ89501.1 hypothetical protein EJK50_2025 [Moraxella catarrhalis]AZQ91206.1 hypothetical protein EJK51_1929 [Moraxella catarrhalis]